MRRMPGNSKHRLFAFACLVVAGCEVGTAAESGESASAARADLVVLDLPLLCNGELQQSEYAVVRLSFVPAASSPCAALELREVSTESEQDEPLRTCEVAPLWRLDTSKAVPSGSYTEGVRHAETEHLPSGSTRSFVLDNPFDLARVTRDILSFSVRLGAGVSPRSILLTTDTDVCAFGVKSGNYLGNRTSMQEYVTAAPKTGIPFYLTQDQRLWSKKIRPFTMPFEVGLCDATQDEFAQVSISVDVPPAFKDDPRYVGALADLMWRDQKGFAAYVSPVVVGAGERRIAINDARVSSGWDLRGLDVYLASSTSIDGKLVDVPQLDTIGAIWSVQNYCCPKHATTCGIGMSP